MEYKGENEKGEPAVRKSRSPPLIRRATRLPAPTCAYLSPESVAFGNSRLLPARSKGARAPRLRQGRQRISTALSLTCGERAKNWEVPPSRCQQLLELSPNYFGKNTVRHREGGKARQLRDTFPRVFKQSHFSCCTQKGHPAPATRTAALTSRLLSSFASKVAVKSVSKSHPA